MLHRNVTRIQLRGGEERYIRVDVSDSCLSMLGGTGVRYNLFIGEHHLAAGRMCEDAASVIKRMTNTILHHDCPEAPPGDATPHTRGRSDPMVG